MKVFWILTAFAAVVLGAAAVWLGGLNQDEGWYLYAANLVHEGRMPFRDFAYTQGPVLPYVYSAFTGVWRTLGLLGARLFTLALGASGIVFAAALARRRAPDGAKSAAALTVCLLLGANLYHLYYLSIPKTYALASLFVLVGFFLASFGGAAAAAAAGLSLAFAAGTRISLGALLVVVGLHLLATRRWQRLLWFCIGGLAGLALVYLPFLCDAGARAGLIAAQRYHAARGGFDPVWTIGSLSRLVRWYLPVFVVGGLGVAGALAGGRRDGRRPADGASVLLWGFAAVFAVQLLAPFPYEDYQVPVMGLLAAYAAVRFAELPPIVSLRRPGGDLRLLLVLGLAFAGSFGSPLLERWMTNGQDRFWPLKKERCELAQLREVAKRIERMDPGGKTLLTQDTYLAVETNRKVPEGLEMGPFSVLSDAAWRKLLAETAPAECAVAAMSGYAFAVEPPKCGERPVERQLEYWGLLKERYELAGREEAFGQNATPLLLLKRK